MFGRCARQTLGRRLVKMFVIASLAFSVSISTPTSNRLARAAAGGSIVHVVRQGETLWAIGARYGVSVQQLIRLNELSDPDRLVIGQRLVIREGDASIHVVSSGETLSGIAALYDVRVQDLIALNELSNPNRLVVGQELVIVPRVQRTHVVRAGDTLWDIARTYEVSVEAVTAANGVLNPRRLKIGEELIIPAVGGGDGGPVLPTIGRTTLRGPAFIWPVHGRVTSNFGPRWGRMHYGVDIAAPTGTPVYAAAAGTVTYSDWAGTYGMLVKIDHGNGVETRYAHNSQLLVKVGDKVQQGQRIALVGTTGASTGPHLHFEVVIDGERRDPLSRLPRR